MKIRFGTTIICFIISLYLHASDSTYNWLSWKDTWSKKKLDTSSIKLPSQNFFIKDIQVIDMRTDTKIWGLFQSKSNQPKAIVLDAPINRFMNNKLVDSYANDSFILVLRSFWLKDSNVYVYRGTNQPFQPDSSDKFRHGRIKLIPIVKLTATIDVFIKKEIYYYPLVRLDTSFQSPDNSDKTCESLMTKMLFALKEKMYNRVFLNQFQRKKAATYESIVENYSKVFQIPILKDLVIKKGVFFNWNQFKNNQPDTTTQYNFKTNKDKSLTVYIKNINGIETILQDVFAICEGNHLYKINNGSAYNMYRDNNSFYWMGVGGDKVNNFWIPLALPFPGITVGGTMSMGTKISEWYFPSLLNLETGEKY